MAEARICPLCDRPQRFLFETTDGPACSGCLRYSGAGRTEPSSWRFNAMRTDGEAEEADGEGAER